MSRRARLRLLSFAVGLLAVGLLAVALVLTAGGSRATGAAVAPAPPRASTATLQWSRPRFAERAPERRQMVRRHIEGDGITDRAVLAAMSHVPRHEFVPRSRLRAAYANHPLPIGHGQTISQPFIVGYMTQQLKLKPGDKVLEIGTGSGYQAAVLSEITPHVYTIEIIRALGTQAQARFARLGYKTIRCKIADGYHGWPEHGPFDAIIVTCAAGTIPPPLVKQLKPDGRMCIPVGPPGRVQRLILVTKDTEGKARSRSLIPVAFVPLTRRRR